MFFISFCAFFVSFVITFLISFLFTKYHLFIDDSSSDKPQNFHTNSTPRSGGIGILIGLLFLLDTIFGVKFLISVFLAFASGIFEDFHNSLDPKFRLFLHLVAASSAVVFTHSVILYLGLGIYLPYGIGVVFSIFAIVGMINAINIIDGFHGLASGVVLMMLSSFAIVAYIHQNSDILFAILITIGAVFGFFLLNFPRGRIFLGDGGAYMLGLVVALFGIYLAGSYDYVSPWYILAIFIYPVWEVLFSIGRKIFMKKSPFLPDPYHFHMLIFRQITHNNPLTSVVILLFISPFIILSTLTHNQSKTNILIALLFIFCYSIAYACLYKRDKKRG